jgi:hypothetical protein
MRYLIIVFLCLIYKVSFCQSFYKLYSGNGFDEGQGIAQLTDSSYVITGGSGSFNDNSQVFLLAVDKLGNYSWSKSYGGSESDIGKRVLLIPNDGFLIAGFSNSYGQGDFDACLIKTDLNGNEEWTKSFNLPSSWEKINDAALTADSGIVMVGEILPTANGNSDIYVIRTDKYGDTLWTKRWGSTGPDFATSIERKNDNFIIAGQWYISDSTLYKGFLMEIDGNGNEIWKDTISYSGGNYVINDVSLSANRIYAVGNKNTTLKTSAYFGIFDLSGNLLNQFITEIDQNKYKCKQAQYISTLNKVAIAYQTINPSTFQDNFDLVYAFFDSDYLGWMDQYKSINNEGIDDVGQIISTLDGGFAGIGFSNSTGFSQNTFNGGSHIYLFKVGINNIFPETESVTTLNQLVRTNNIESTIGKLYPNPVNSILKIQFKKQGTYNFNLFDIYGKEIHAGQLNQFDQMDFTEFPKGIYLLTVDNNSFRIIKE